MSSIKKFTALFLTVLLLVSFIPQAAFAASGWAKEGSSWIYVTNGKRATGWKKISGKWYFFNPGGIMISSSAVSEDNRDYYFVGSDGAMKTKAGWYKTSWGSWVYARSGGKLVAEGWKKIGGKWYYFDGSYLLTNCYIGDYYVDGNGVMVTNFWTSGKSQAHVEVSDGVYEWRDFIVWSYYGSSGKKCTGWKKIGGSWYCFNPYGQLFEQQVISADGLFTPTGNTYYYSSAGLSAPDSEDARAQKMYFVDEGGKMQTKAGLVRSYADYKVFYPNSKGEIYYVQEGGEIFTGGWKQLNGNWYYFDPAECGKAARSHYEGQSYYIEGEGAYHFDENGICLDKDK